MKKENQKITEVEIYNEIYKIINEGSPEYTCSLADYVDERMREITKSGVAIPPVKLAVLAALNIADDLFKAKKEIENEKELTSKAADNLYRMVKEHTKS